MADFLDSEAEESDNEELSPNEKKKLKRHKAIDTDDEEEEEGMVLSVIILNLYSWLLFKFFCNVSFVNCKCTLEQFM